MLRKWISTLCSICLLHLQLISLPSGMVFADGIKDVADPIAKETYQEGKATHEPQSHQHTGEVKGLGFELSVSKTLNLFVMMTIGFITASMLGVCTDITIDMLVAILGGLAFVAGEFIEFFNYKAAVDQMKSEVTGDYKESFKYTDGRGVEGWGKQRKLLQKQKESLEKIKNLSELKEKFQLGAASAFGVAAATAVGMDIVNKVNFSACLAGATRESIQSEGAKAPVCSASQNFAGMLFSWGLQPHLEGSRTFSTTYYNTKAARDAAFASCTPECVSYGQSYHFSVGVCQPEAANPATTPVFASNTEVSVDHIASFFEQALNLIFPQAQARQEDIMTVALFVGQMGAIVSGVFMGLFTPLFKFMDGFIAVPLWRSILWVGLGALSGAATASTQLVRSKVEDRISDIEKLIAKIDRIDRGPIVAQDQPKQDIPVTIPPKVEELQLVPEGESLPCPKDKKTGKCANYKELLTNNVSFKQLDSNTQGLIKDVSALGTNLFGSSNLSSGTISSLNNLNSKSNAIKQAQNRAQEKINSLLKKEGKDPIDFDKSLASFNKDLKGTIEKGLSDKKDSSGSPLLASLGNPQVQLEKEENKQASIKDKATKLGVTQSGGMGGVVLPNSKAESKSFTFKLEDDKKEEEIVALGTSQHKDVPALGSLEKSKTDVSDPSRSLFTIISQRYKKSGYPRLFEATQD